MNITPYFKIRKQGFTLIELLVAAAIGMVTTMTAGHVLTSQIDATQRINRKENLRNNWVKANKFITSEIHQSIKVSEIASEQDRINCDLRNDQIRLVVHFPRAKKIIPAIYYISNDEGIWDGLVLRRCGPDIDNLGNYTEIVSDGIIINKLRSQNTGFTTSIQGNKLVQFNISLDGLDSARYQQQGGARSRLQTVLLKPDESMICLEPSKGLINGRKINLTADANNYAFEDNDNTLICGHGGGDTIRGGNGDDVIEAGGTIASDINGGNGDDRLIGSEGDDLIRGGNGDDILIGLGGNDTLQGGTGKNLFITGIDDKSISCNHDEVVGVEDSYNIVFFKENIEKYTLSQPCNKAECRVMKNNTSNTKVTNILLGDTLVFADRVIHLEQGEEGNFLPIDREACNTEVTTLEPPVQEDNPEDDPRWTPLLEGVRIGLRIVNTIKERYTLQSQRRFIDGWTRNVDRLLSDLPEDIRQKFCFRPAVRPWTGRRNGRILPTTYTPQLIFTPRINNRCEWMATQGNGLINLTAIKPSTRILHTRAQITIPKEQEGVMYRSCNLHQIRWWRTVPEGRFYEARGC